jgi:hypothetical protein
MNIGKNTRHIAVLLVLALFLGSMIILTPASADTEPANNSLATAETCLTTGAWNPGHVNVANDPVDIYKIPAAQLTGGPTAATNITITFNMQMFGTPMTDYCVFQVANSELMLIYNYGAFSDVADRTFSFFSQDGSDVFVILWPWYGETYYNFSVTLTTEANPLFDSNNDPTTAAGITPNVPVNDIIHQERDYHDYYKWDAVKGDELNISLVSPQAELALDILYDNASSGNVDFCVNASLSADGTTTQYADYIVEVNATHYIYVASLRLEFLFFNVYLGAGNDTYTLTLNVISPPAPGTEPYIANGTATPNSIVDNAATDVDLECNASAQGLATIAYVNATCDLWAGVVTMTAGTFDNWTATKNIASGASIGVHTVTFNATDDNGEWNETEADITVTKGSSPPTLKVSDPYEIDLEEDDPPYEKALGDLFADDDFVNCTFKFDLDGTSWATTYESDNISVELNASDAQSMIITLTENAFGTEDFLVNCTDSDSDSKELTVRVNIDSMNDVPTWDKVEKVVPTGTAVNIVHGEDIELAVDEDSVFNYTIVATDLEGDTLTYSCNVTNNDRLTVEDSGNFSFAPIQEDVGIVRDYNVLYLEFTVDDGNTGGTNTTNVNFNISNVNDAPDEPGLAVTVVENQLLQTFKVTRPTDEDGDTNFTYKFDFDNDGTDDETVSFTEDETFDFEYEFAEAGIYTIKLTAEDEGGLSNFTTLVDVEITAGAAWWKDPWATGDWDDDIVDTVEIAWTKCTVVNTYEEDVPAAGEFTSTTVYTFEGTCSDNVAVVYLYTGVSIDGADFTYMAAYDSTDMMAPEKIEIEPEDGVWEYTWTFEITGDIPDPVTDDDDDDPPTVETWYAAVGWTEEGDFNIAETIADTSGEEPGPEAEWWDPWEVDDKIDDADDTVEIKWTELVVKTEVKEDDPEEGKSTAYTTIKFKGTCSDNVEVVYIYFGTQTNDESFEYMAYPDPEDFMKKLEIEADNGEWEYTYETDFTYDTPDPVEDDDDDDDDEYHLWYAAVGWTEDGAYAIAERELGADDDDGDDDGDGIGMLGVAGIVGCIVLFVILIVVVIIIIMVVMKKKKKPAEEPPAPPEEAGPVMCACGVEIPAGEPTCPGCGEPAPPPPPEGEVPPPPEGAEGEIPPPAEGVPEAPEGAEEGVPEAEGAGVEEPGEPPQWDAPEGGEEPPAPPEEGGEAPPPPEGGEAPPPPA